MAKVGPFDSYEGQRHRSSRKVSAGRREEAAAQRQGRLDAARRQGESPRVAMGLAGNPSADDVARWTTYLPAKPPGRT
jgi:hypothetical protein